MAEDMKKNVAVCKIMIYLGENGPELATKISEELEIKYNTVMYDLNDSVFAKYEIFRKLDNDKYALRWHLDDEYSIKDAYESLSDRLLRPPLPEEIAGVIKKTPAESRDLLFKFIPGYREPTTDEINSSEKNLCRLIFWGSWFRSGHPAGKKSWFESGISKVAIQGIDDQTFNDFQPDLKIEAEEYLKNSPELKLEIASEEIHNELSYKVKWTQQVKNIFRSVQPWNETIVLKIPLKFNEVKSFNWQPYEGFYAVKELARYYAPSQNLINFLLYLIGLPHLENEVLLVLKEFCKNALEIDLLDEETKQKIASVLMDVAFVIDLETVRKYENINDADRERNNAFDIIEVLDVRSDEIIKIAEDYVYENIPFSLMIPESAKGPNLRSVAKWLAKDPSIKTKIVKEIDKMISEEGWPEGTVALTYLLRGLI